MDGTFDKMKPLFEGEQYDPPDAEKRKRREARNAMRVSDAPFRPSQPMKQSSGLGDYYGCLGKPNVHIGARASENQLKKGDVTLKTSNIKTNPSKKGSYGTIGTTLGEKLGKVGAVGEYKYVSCDYEWARKDAVASAKGSREKNVSNEPFKPCSPAKKGGSRLPRADPGAQVETARGLRRVRVHGDGPGPPLEDGEVRDELQAVAVCHERRVPARVHPGPSGRQEGCGEGVEAEGNGEDGGEGALPAELLPEKHHHHLRPRKESVDGSVAGAPPRAAATPLSLSV